MPVGLLSLPLILTAGHILHIPKFPRFPLWKVTLGLVQAAITKYRRLVAYAEESHFSQFQRLKSQDQGASRRLQPGHSAWHADGCALTWPRE